jgi:uncharacterized membrane protein
MKSDRLSLSSALLLSIVIFGICFRVYNVGYRPFWLDELYSVSYANLAIESLFKVLHTNIQMPLYFMLLHAWIWIFGDSDVAVRSLSILFGLLGILGFFFLLRRGLRWPLNSCLMGVALLAVNPFHVYYSIEARTYSLMFALSTLYLTALVLMHAEGDKKYYLAYAFLQVLLLYTHPIALIYCFCINATYVFLLFFVRELSWSKIRNLLVASLVTVVIIAPGATILMRQAHLIHKSFWAQLPSPIGALKIWLSITLFWSPELVEFLSSNFTFIRPLIWTCIFIPFLLLMARGVIYVIRRKNLLELLIVLSLFVYPASVYLFSLLFKPIFMNKILISSLIGLLVLIVIPEKKHFAKTKPSNLLLLSLFLLISISLSFAVTSIDNNADWRKIAAAIAQRAEPEDLVLVYKSYGASLLKRYYKGNLEFKGVTHDFEEEMKQRELHNYNGSTYYSRPFFSQDVLDRLHQLIDGRKRFFVVFSPISNNEVVIIRDFMLSNYIANEIIVVKQSQILLLSSKP